MVYAKLNALRALEPRSRDSADILRGDQDKEGIPESALPLAPHLAAIAWSVAADVHIEKTFEI